MSNSRIISVYNNKGGVAKTTMNIHIALYLAGIENKKVLVIDADSQSNLTSRIYAFSHNNLTFGDLMLNKLPLKDAIVKSPIEHYPTLDLIPANRNMKFIEEILVSNTNAEKDLSIAYYLIDNIDTVNEYDYIIWDASPSLSVLGRNVLNTCNKIIFVSEYNNIDSLEAVALFADELRTSREKLGMSMPDFAVLINRYKNTKDSSTEIYNQFEQHLDGLKEHMLKTKMIESSVIKNANLCKQNIVDYTNSNKVNQRAMNLFIDIINELKERGII